MTAAEATTSGPAQRDQAEEIGRTRRRPASAAPARPRCAPPPSIRPWWTPGCSIGLRLIAVRAARACRWSRCGCGSRSPAPNPVTRRGPSCSPRRCSADTARRTRDRHRRRARRRSARELGVGVDPERLLIGGSGLADGPAGRTRRAGRRAHRRRVPGRRGRPRARPAGRADHGRPRAAPGDRPRGAAARAGTATTRSPARCPRPTTWPQSTADAGAGAARRRRGARSASTLVLVGDLSLDDVRRARSSGRSPGGHRTEWPSELPEPPPLRGEDLLLVDRPGRRAVPAAAVGRPALPRTDERYPALQLANLVLGGYFSSRLVENLREDKGYTYHASSGLEFSPAQRCAAGGDRHRHRGHRGGAAGDALRAGPARGRAAHRRRGRVGPAVRDRLAADLAGHPGRPGLHARRARRRRAGRRLVAQPPATAGGGHRSTRSAAAALEFFSPSAFTGVVVGDVARHRSPNCVRSAVSSARDRRDLHAGLHAAPPAPAVPLHPDPGRGGAHRRRSVGRGLAARADGGGRQRRP